MSTGMDNALALGSILPQGLPQASAKSSKATPAMDKAAKDFESVFLAQMLSHMFENVGGDSLADDKESQEVYRAWMTDQYGSIIANHGGIGITGYVKNELLRQQEIASGQTPNAIAQPTAAHP